MVFVTVRGIYGLVYRWNLEKGQSILSANVLFFTTLKEEEAEDLGAGDVERLVIEWKCLLDLIAHGPDLGIPRWTELQNKARKLGSSHSQAEELPQLPELPMRQRRRFEGPVRRG